MTPQQKLHLKKFLELYPECNPFGNQIWGDYTLNYDDVIRSIARGLFSDVPVPISDGKEIHAGRIAWLVINGWNEDPIDIDVGVPGFGDVLEIVQDGNHRLAAAILRGDDFIPVECSGDEELINEIVVV